MLLRYQFALNYTTITHIPDIVVKAGRLFCMVAAVASAPAALGCGNDAPTTSAAASRPQVVFAQVGDIKLAYYERGSGSPLLMNIGSASTMSEWDPALLARLAQHHRLIIYDYRGIGLSSRIPRSGLTIERLADDAVALLDRLEIPKADVLGWSLGGFVAQQIAIRHPQRVDHLVLAATNPGGSRTTFGPPRAQRIDSDPQATDQQVLSVNFPQSPEGRRAARSFLRRLERAADAGTIPDDFTVPRSGYLAQNGAESRWYESNDNLRRLRELRIPTLVATGREDLLTPPANSRLIAERIPGSQLALFRRAGHAFLFQDNARFAGLLDRFAGPSQ